MIDFFLLSITFLSLLSIISTTILLFRFKAGLAPLLIVCIVTAALTISGMLNGAFITAITILIISVPCLVFTVYRIVKNKAELLLFNDLGLYSFIGLSLFIITLFSIRQPLFFEWDEFSFWGTAARIVSDSNLLYTVAENNMVGTTHPPALIMFSYLFNFLGEYAPFKTYIAYDMLVFSAFGAVLSCFDNKLKHISFPVLLVFICSPLIAMNLYGRSIQVLPGYMSAYSDFPMGILIAAILIICFCRSGNRLQTFIVTIAALFVLTLCKEMGFAFAMLCAGIVAVDLVITDRELLLPKRLIAALLIIATPVAAFASWSMHLSAAAGVNRFEVGGEQNLGMVELMFTGVYELFVPAARSEKFDAVFNNLWNAFLYNKVIVFGSGFVVFLVVTILLIIAFLLTDQRNKKTSIIIYYVMTCLGCFAYTVFLGFTYAYVFKGADGIGLISYERYVMPYYTGWFLSALTFTVYLLRINPRFKFITQPLMVIGCCGIFLSAHYFTPSQYNYLNYPDSYFSTQYTIQNKVSEAKQYISPDSNVFYIHSDDNGIGWFQNYYYFLPMHIDYSGGGDLARFDSDGFEQYIIEQNIDVVYIDSMHIEHEAPYLPFFSDALLEYKEGRSYIYSVNVTGDTITLNPITMGE